MPTYQYACTDCGDRSEVVQRFTDEALTVCAVCGGKLRKVFSPVGIVFKGSGFYRTDSRDSSRSVAAANGSSNGSNGSDKKDSAATTESASSKSSESSSSGSKSSDSAPGSGKKASSVGAGSDS